MRGAKKRRGSKPTKIACPLRRQYRWEVLEGAERGLYECKNCTSRHKFEVVWFSTEVLVNRILRIGADNCSVTWCPQVYEFMSFLKTKSRKFNDQMKNGRHDMTNIAATNCFEPIEQLWSIDSGINHGSERIFQTYPADCRKIAAVDSNKHDWDWNNRRYWKKKRIFVQKHFFKSDLFWWHFVVEYTSVS